MSKLNLSCSEVTAQKCFYTGMIHHSQRWDYNMILFEDMLLCVFAISFFYHYNFLSYNCRLSWSKGWRGLSHGHSAFPSWLATYMQRDIKKVREVERKGGWKASPHQMKSKQYAYQHPKETYHFAGKNQDKRIIWHNSSKHIAPVKTSVIFYRNAPF